MKRTLTKDSSVLRGVWLNPGPVKTSIENLLIQMLELNQPNPKLRQSLIEEFNRRVKRKEVLFEYLSLKEVGTDHKEKIALHLVSPQHSKNPWQPRDPWKDALLSRPGDCPIGFVVNTCDQGRVVVVHEVFSHLTNLQQELIRKYAALAARGHGHDRIVTVLSRRDGEAGCYAEIMNEARRRMQFLDPSVLFSTDGHIRVQVGSISQTTKNILREGIKGDYLFILPKNLFEGKTNYADIEFIVYLNFFVRKGMRTRIAGTARQKEVLERLLNLTIFGLFSPQAAEQPSFEQLHMIYGVPDRATFEFFRMVYEKYSIRRDFDPNAPILGIGNYVDFVVLNEEGRSTMIPVHKMDHGKSFSGMVQVVAQNNGIFDVSISQSNGNPTKKQLEVTPPSKVVETIPGELCRAIRFATDRPRFGITPLGTSHGFDPTGDLTSFVIWINGKGILVDPSPEALAYLDQIGVAPADLPYAFLTHVHADHDGGLIEKLLSGSRTTAIASDVVFRAFVEKGKLVTGYDFKMEGLVEHLPANPGTPVLFEVAGERATLETRWNLHPIPTNGFKLTIGGKTFGYSADTQYDPDLIRQLRAEKKLSQRQYDDLMYFFWDANGEPKIDLLYHEAGIPPIHTEKGKLEALPETTKARIYLVHIADRDVPQGFLPGKPRLFATQVLLPSTDRSRKEILLRTLESVSYLYDVPAETLEGLLEMAKIRTLEGDETIIRKGPVNKGEDLHFYVIADGEVAIKDGNRLIAKLSKPNSFGEWGISHQRGFRVADAAAFRPTQLMDLDEEAYHWMVRRHPAIQERIGKIRGLLPRLQLAQARARQKTQHDPQRTRSVIEDMNSSQLSTFAVFSEVKKFNHGESVVVEGEEADGFYILLSGHLTVTVKGKVVGDLSEADVFGEVGLLERGKRMASVQVTSADAEILFMSRQNFQALLENVPAFSFGIRVMAARRQEIGKLEGSPNSG